MTALLDRDTKCDGIGAGNVVQFKDVAIYVQGGRRTFADVDSIVSKWHCFVLVKGQSRLDVRKFSFSQRITIVWTTYLLVPASCVNMSKNRIDKYLVRAGYS